VCYKVCVMGGGMRGFRGFVVLAVSWVVLSCASPTLPLPPPAIPTFSDQNVPTGEVKLQSIGGAEPNAIIVIYNLNPNVPLDQRVGGAQANAAGTWDATVTASTGDNLEISQEVGADTSPSTTVVVPAL